LQTDSAATFSTKLSVIAVSLLRPFTILLVGVAAIVTPLGLYETVTPHAAGQSEVFGYLKDNSPIGLGTPPRTNTTWSRICGDFGYVNCPFSGNDIIASKNSTGIYTTTDGFSSKIPQDYVNAFQSGLSAFGASVSSIFDIQYRSITTRIMKETAKSPPIDDGEAYNIGSYRPMSTLVLNDDVGLYEGLVVDMKNGGIGFRNHTAPPHTRFGSTWFEDILFIEPESVCVDTNLTIDFEIPAGDPIGTDGLQNMVLTDRGGFVNLDHKYPNWSREDVQSNPELYLRAYKAAWINNAMSMAFMNVTSLTNETMGTKAFAYMNSTMNKTFPLHWADGTSINSLVTIKPSMLQVKNTFGDYLYTADEGRRNYTGSNFSTSLDDEDIRYSEPPLYSNPFNVQIMSSLATRDSLKFSDACKFFPICCHHFLFALPTSLAFSLPLSLPHPSSCAHYSNSSPSLPRCWRRRHGQYLRHHG
jgi:hypothetical protein